MAYPSFYMLNVFLPATGRTLQPVYFLGRAVFRLENKNTKKTLKQQNQTKSNFIHLIVFEFFLFVFLSPFPACTVFGTDPTQRKLLYTPVLNSNDSCQLKIDMERARIVYSGKFSRNNHIQCSSFYQRIRHLTSTQGDELAPTSTRNVFKTIIFRKLRTLWTFAG